ncbi:dsDNA nuclease domain-containing protein [Rhizobium ruizarguesonis]|uniref:DUF4297 domain-containing protein n=1 Tax=Rhizobium ruizarguesonis TaxID=2081791 RepID=A0AB38HTE3_9HYPH|nr:dsDNA nuclease domain-containing protein [Rhizobium ruizarguesonis]TBC02924.1 DUF4297 domain-containing protein [Rhizobium ruizarguesonis]
MSDAALQSYQVDVIEFGEKAESGNSQLETPGSSRHAPPPMPKGARDAGDQTARNYRYQHSYAVILLASACRGERDYQAVWCEHHEDILAERTDGKFDGWQIKTRRPESGAWTTSSPDFVAALGRFVALTQYMGEALADLHFVSNAEFQAPSSTKDIGRISRSPLAFLDAVKGAPILSAVSQPFREIITRLASQFRSSPQQVFDTLLKVHLVVGPSRGEIDATLSNEHLARIEAHKNRTAEELNSLRDDLVGLIARASSLHVTSPQRHLHPMTSLVSEGPTVGAKRVSIEVLTLNAMATKSIGHDKLLAGLGLKLDDILRLLNSDKSGGLTKEQVTALLDAFSEFDATIDDPMPLLLRKADELRAFQASLADQMADDPDDDKRFEPVLDAMKRGDFDAADEALETLAETGAVGREAVLAQATHMFAMRGSLALARLRYEVAAEHFATSAAIARSFNKPLMFSLLAEQAQALTEQSRLNGGMSGFRQALAILHERVETAPTKSFAWFIAITDLIATMGLACERAATPQANEMVRFALDLSREALSLLDEVKHTDLWLSLATNLGAILNHAVRYSYDKENAQKLNQEAIALLTRAVQIAKSNGGSELANLEINLATAYRRSSVAAADPRAALESAIFHRLEVLTDEKVLSRGQLGNAYDSLGNDYAELAIVGARTLDRDAFRRALAAYRKALSVRDRSLNPIDWARTQFNIAAHYGRAYRLSGGSTDSRYGLAGLRRLELALSVLSREASPQDWANACAHSGTIVAEMLSEQHEIEFGVIEKTITRLAEVAEFADRVIDAELVLRTLDTQASITLCLFLQRHSAAPRIITLANERLQPRLVAYRQTLWRVLFELADAQHAFMLGHLADDRLKVSQAIDALKEALSKSYANDQEDFLELGRSVLADMEDQFAQMPS